MSDAWTWSGQAWQSADGQTEVLSADHLPPGASSLTIRVGADVPSETALEALITATQVGIVQFRVGLPDGDLLSVGLPPPPSAARDFAVIHAGASGVRVSSPGGAEHHVSCGECAAASDWSLAGVSEALDGAETPEVLVSVSPAVPWGVAVAALQVSGDRPLRIARER